MQFIFAFPPFGCPIGDGLLNLRIQHLTQLALGSNGKELIHLIEREQTGADIVQCKPTRLTGERGIGGWQGQ